MRALINLGKPERATRGLFLNRLLMVRAIYALPLVATWLILHLLFICWLIYLGIFGILSVVFLSGPIVAGWVGVLDIYRSHFGIPRIFVFSEILIFVLWICLAFGSRLGEQNGRLIPSYLWLPIYAIIGAGLSVLIGARQILERKKVKREVQ
jgi:hypothetical protein